MFYNINPHNRYHSKYHFKRSVQDRVGLPASKLKKDCSSSQFALLMENYGYWRSKDLQGSDYTHLLYENNSLDFYLDGNDGLGVNYIELSETYRHAQFFGGLSNIYPHNSLVNLRNALKPYYRDTTQEGIERFVLEDGVGGGYLIQILIKQRTHYEVHIQHFAKLH